MCTVVYLPRGKMRKPQIHKLTNIDYSTMTADCKNCGRVKIRSRGYRYGRDKKLQVRCALAMSKDQSNGVHRLRAKVNEVKTTAGCSKCGYNRCAGALEFHHIQDNKEENIGVLVGKRNSEKLWKEIEKCIVVCANCHREIHYELLYKETNETVTK